MINLEDKLGLPLSLDEETYQVSFGEGVPVVEPGVRTLKAIYPVTRDEEPDGPPILYWMYRDVCRPEDREKLRPDRLRFDLSVFVPAKLGSELLKSSGHFHPLVPGFPISYPELYEVVHGQATFILQKVNNICARPQDLVVEDVIVLEVQAGQKAMMPPDYGHVTVNTGAEPLVTVNWVCTDFTSHYYSVEQMRGFAYYLLAGEPPALERNPMYREAPPVRYAVPADVPELGLISGRPVYTECVRSPNKFAFVREPQKYMEEMWAALAFEV